MSTSYDLPDFPVKVTQVYRATRTIIVKVRAEDLESAIEDVRSGSEDVPNFDDPGWKTGWQLLSEEVADPSDDPQVTAEDHQDVYGP